MQALKIHQAYMHSVFAYDNLRLLQNWYSSWINAASSINEKFNMQKQINIYEMAHGL